MAPHGLQQESPDDIEEQTSTRWMLWTFVSLGVVAILWWMYFDRAAVQMKNWWGRSYVSAITASLEAEDWSSAARDLAQATRWAPDDPEVLRVAVDFVTRTGSDPRTMIRFLERLEDIGKITIAEKCLLGRMHVRVPDLSKAHQIYDALPPQELSKRPALELLSAIQHAEGLHARSFLTQRQALLADPDDPDSVLQLALLDARSGDASLSGPARERLWPIARAGGSKAVPAIEFLAQHRQLAASEAAELMGLVESLPEGPKTVAVRFQVLSATARLNPHRRQDIFNHELQRWAGKPPAMIPPLLQWLVTEKENQRVLRIVTPRNAATYGAVLPFYVDALRGEKMWGEVKKLITGRVDPSFSRIQLRLWLAEAEARLTNDPTTPKQILNSLLDESGRGENLEVARRTAEAAERLGHWDIARRCYEAAAERHPAQEINLLLKVYDTASHETNGQAMLRASERLRVLKATDVIFLDRVNYLRLVLGTDIEIALDSLDATAKVPQHHITPDRKIALSLLRALAAYRSGRLDQIAAHLAEVRMIDTFPPGPRAVYAGLLAISGDTAGAYKIAEKVPAVLLLSEENRFLTRAL